MSNSNEYMSKVSKFYSDDERNKLTKKEYNKYRRICKGLPESKKKIALPLVENLAFLVIMQQELREIIKRDGYSEEYMNGKNQKGIKRTVAADLLIAAQKNYSMLFKQFKDLLPNEFSSDDMDNWDAANEI